MEGRICGRKLIKWAVVLPANAPETTWMQLCESKVLLQHRHCRLLWEMGGREVPKASWHVSITRLHEHVLQPSGQGIFKDKG